MSVTVMTLLMMSVVMMKVRFLIRLSVLLAMMIAMVSLEKSGAVDRDGGDTQHDDAGA